MQLPGSHGGVNLNPKPTWANYNYEFPESGCGSVEWGGIKVPTKNSGPNRNASLSQEVDPILAYCFLRIVAANGSPSSDTFSLVFYPCLGVKYKLLDFRNSTLQWAWTMPFFSFFLNWWPVADYFAKISAFPSVIYHFWLFTRTFR